MNERVPVPRPRSNHFTTQRLARAILAAPLALIGTCGCTLTDSTVRLTSYQDPHFPETFRITFDDCACWQDAGGDTHIAARAVSQTGGDETAVRQLMHVHLFWKPRPGKTADNPTSVDAIVRYAVASSGGVAVYRGTAFVYPQEQKNPPRLVAQLERAELRPAGKLRSPPEILGTMRIEGTLAARDDGNLAVDIIRELDQYAAAAK